MRNLRENVLRWRRARTATLQGRSLFHSGQSSIALAKEEESRFVMVSAVDVTSWQATRLCEQGFAMLEAALAFVVLLPVCLCALAVWNYISTVQELSELVSTALSSVQVRSVKLSNGAQDFTAEINEAELRRAVDALVRDGEVKLAQSMRSFYAAYRIEGVLIDRTVSSGAKPQQRVLYTSHGGALDAPTPFSSQGVLESEQVAREGSGFSAVRAGLGLSITLKPQVGFMSSLIAAFEPRGEIQVAKTVDLRGEFLWD